MFPWYEYPVNIPFASQEPTWNDTAKIIAEETVEKEDIFDKNSGKINCLPQETWDAVNQVLPLPKDSSPFGDWGYAWDGEWIAPISLYVFIKGQRFFFPCLFRIWLFVLNLFAGQAKVSKHSIWTHGIASIGFILCRIFLGMGSRGIITWIGMRIFYEFICTKALKHAPWWKILTDGKLSCRNYCFRNIFSEFLSLKDIR